MNLSRERACGGKRRHRTRAAATTAVRSLRSLGARRLTPYRCPHCPYWHVGHLPYPEETTP